MPTTLADVARRAGVSPATASRVLNKSPHGVTPDLQARVLAAADELRYVPNAHARALARSATSTLGVIVHDVSDPYFAQIMRGILQVAGEADRLAIICNTYRDPDKELEYVELLHAHRVEALILAGSGRHDRRVVQAMTDRLEPFVAAGGHVALVGRHYITGDTVGPDNVGGARALGEALVELGHRRIGVITGPRFLTSTHDRMAGFRAALSDADVDLPDELVVESDHTRDGGAAAVERLLEHDPAMTAVWAMNDAMALGALGVLRRRGVRVPQDLSLAGFNGEPVAADVTPSLTTVEVPLTEIGARAAEMALEPSESLRLEQHPTTLRLRDSTAPPAAGR